MRAMAASFLFSIRAIIRVISVLWFFRIGGKVVDQFREISVQGFFMGIIAAVNHGDMIGTSLTVDRRVQFFIQTIPVCPYIPEIEQPVP